MMDNITQHLYSVIDLDQVANDFADQLSQTPDSQDRPAPGRSALLRSTMISPPAHATPRVLSGCYSPSWHRTPRFAGPAIPIAVLSSAS